MNVTDKTGIEIWRRENITMLHRRISQKTRTGTELDLGLYPSYCIAPWCLCQRLWSGNRSSCQRQTFCPDIKYLSAGHRCNLLAQTFRLTLYIFSCLLERRIWNLLCLSNSSLLTSLNNLWYWVFVFDNWKEQKNAFVGWRILTKDHTEFAENSYDRFFFTHMARLGFLPLKLSLTVTWTRHRWKLLHRFQPGK